MHSHDTTSAAAIAIDNINNIKNRRADMHKYEGGFLAISVDSTSSFLSSNV